MDTTSTAELMVEQEVVMHVDGDSTPMATARPAMAEVVPISDAEQMALNLSRVARKQSATVEQKAQTMDTVGHMLSQFNTTWRAVDTKTYNFRRFLLQSHTILMDTYGLVPQPFFGPAHKPLDAIMSNLSLKPQPSMHGFVFESYSNQRVYTAAVDPRTLPVDMSCIRVVVPVKIGEHEHDLFRVFQVAGTVYEFRLEIDAKTNEHTGTVFVTYCEKEAGQCAMKALDGMVIMPSCPLKVEEIEPRTRLFVGNLPKCKNNADLEKTFYLMTSALKLVISFPSSDVISGNRGFCFLEYTTHGAAVAAKERLMSMKIFGTDLVVEFAKEDKKAIRSKVYFNPPNFCYESGQAILPTTTFMHTTM